MYDLYELIKTAFEKNPNKHIYNGTKFYINCEGWGWIEIYNNEYYLTSGIFSIKYRKVKDLNPDEIYKLKRLLKEKIKSNDDWK